MTGLLAVLALFQQQPAAPAPPKPATLAPSPIAKLAITPGSKVTMTAGDTLRLRVAALDSGGKQVEGVTYKYFPGRRVLRGQGGFDRSHLLGSTGAMGVSVVASVPGTKPVVERVEVRMVPGPATRVALEPAVGEVVVGQRLRLHAVSYSAANDQRNDRSPGSVRRQASRGSAMTVWSPASPPAAPP